MRMGLRIAGLVCLAVASFAMANGIIWPGHAPLVLPGWANALATAAGLSGFVFTRGWLAVRESRRASPPAHSGD